MLGRYRDGESASQLAVRLETSSANVRQMLVRIRRQIKRCVELRAPSRGTGVNDSRFEDLVGRLLDDELTPDGWCELLGLVRDDPALLRKLRDQLEASELLALSEDVLRGSPLFLEATRSRLADDRFVSGVRAAIAGARRPPVTAAALDVGGRGVRRGGGADGRRLLALG